MLSDSLIKQQTFIDGAWIGAARTFAVKDPASGAEIAQVPDCGAAETEKAILAAARAFPDWSRKLVRERSVIMRRWYDLIMQNADALAELLTREQGKPLAESKNEIIYGAGFVEFNAEETKRVYGETIPTFRADARLLAIRQPIGPVAAITPWNFPVAMITRKIAPALAAGCTVVSKPAHETPLCALALALLAEQAGFPPGVLNIITTADSAKVGEMLSTHPAIRMIAFTGSTEIGRLLMKQASSTIKKVALELGGNAPFIVFDDADLEQAVEGAIASKFRNSGQTCVCANRFFVQDGIYERFAARFADAIKALKLGNGLEKETTLGPLITQKAVEKVQRHIADALQKGAVATVGGKPDARGGTFFEATLLTNASTDMLIANEETFGPVAALIKFKTEADAIRMANDTPFGLASYVYTRDLGRAWRMAEALESGMVGVNSGLISNEVVPFGGVKQSGLGREGGRHGIEEFLDIKYAMMAGI